MNEIELSREDVLLVAAFVEKAKLSNFKVFKTNQAGIGYTLELEYETESHGKPAKVTVELVGPDQW